MKSNRCTKGLLMPRDQSTIQYIVDQLYNLGLLFLFHDGSCLDQLQVEYLSQIIWTRCVRKEGVTEEEQDIYNLCIPKSTGQPYNEISPKINK